MRRSLSTITLGMLALLLMFSAPVSAQKVLLKQAQNTIIANATAPKTINGKEMVLKKKDPNVKHFENGQLVQKPQVMKKGEKFSDFTNLLEAKSMKIIGLNRANRVAAAQDSPIVPPFEETWDGTNNAYYDIIDANEDGATWTIGSGSAYNTWNTNAEADDWLLSPKLTLEAGTSYTFEANLQRGLSSYPERIEILAGQGDDYSTYTITLLEPTELPYELTAYTATLTPEASGEYRIGFHAISEKDMYRIYLKTWSLSGPPVMTVPGPVTNLQVAAAEGGALNAIIGFTAPAVDKAGDPLQSITKINIVSGDIVKTLENVEPGSEQTVSVAVPESGNYTFTVTAYNEDGNGDPVSASAFIGNDYPTYVKNVVGIDNKNGTATFSWDPYEETTGVYGFPLDLSTLKYNIYGVTDDGNFTDEPIASTTETTYIMDCPNWNQGELDFLYCVVVPEVGGNEGDYNYGSIIIGKNDVIPYAESFADGDITKEFWTNRYIGTSSWGLTEGIAADGDNGCAYFMAGNDGYAAGLNTGKISVQGAQSPVLSFQFYNYDLTPYLFVWADTQNGEEEITLFESEGNEPSGEWNKVYVDLSQFINEEYVIIKFVAYCPEAGATILLDDIQINDLTTPNLSLKLALPGEANGGETVVASATVTNCNTGVVEAGSYSVNFYVNGELYETVTETQALQALNDNAVYSIDYPVSVFEEGPINFKAEVVFADDSDDSDNVDEGSVSVAPNTLPTVDDLSGIEDNGNVNLTWSAPDVDGKYQTKTETFDGDVIDDFIIFDNDGDGYNWYLSQGMISHSGDVCLTSASYAGGVLYPDNWLITPLVKLDGNFSFWACGQDPSWCDEVFGIFVTTETDLDAAISDLSSWTQIGSDITVTGEMTEYSFDLSAYEGQVGYVAIRHYNVSDMFRINVDDITYIPADAEALAITGYNVYRDGELIGTAQDTEFVDEAVADGTHTYNVTVIYNVGESGISNDFEITVEGAWLPGDVDHDGEVSVNDVLAVVKYIKGVTPSEFYYTEANLDGDEEISVSDINLIVKIILSGDGTANVPANVREEVLKVRDEAIKAIEEMEEMK